jgi:phosphatidylglycerophosphatase A
MTPAIFLASGFGAGFAPRAPGTAGSLVGLALGLAALAVSPYLLAACVIITAFGGIPVIRAATGLAVRGDGKGAHDDPGWIVIDEIAGQMLALLALPRPGVVGAALAFLLFRLFDILKPGPVGWADRQGGAAGIMADDVMAGFISCAILLALDQALPVLRH